MPNNLTNLRAVFSHFQCKLPPSETTLYQITDSILLDLDSLEKNNVKKDAINSPFLCSDNFKKCRQTIQSFFDELDKKCSEIQDIFYEEIIKTNEASIGQWYRFKSKITQLIDNQQLDGLIQNKLFTLLENLQEFKKKLLQSSTYPISYFENKEEIDCIVIKNNDDFNKELHRFFEDISTLEQADRFYQLLREDSSFNYGQEPLNRFIQSLHNQVLDASPLSDSLKSLKVALDNYQRQRIINALNPLIDSNYPSSLAYSTFNNAFDEFFETNFEIHDNTSKEKIQSCLKLMINNSFTDELEKLKEIYQYFIENSVHDRLKKKLQSTLKAIDKIENEYLIQQLLPPAPCQSKETDNDLEHQEKLRHLLNASMAEIEESKKGEDLLNLHQRYGVYHYVYDTNYAHGYQNKFLYGLYQKSKHGLLIPVLSVGLYLSLALMGIGGGWMVLATGLLMGSFAYVSAIFYGVLNDLLATKSNLPYFLLGHNPGQKSIVKTNDKIVNSTVWGHVATFALGLVAAFIFTVTGIFTAAFCNAATFILPLLIIAIPIITLLANAVAERDINFRLMTNKDNQESIYVDQYVSTHKRFMMPTSKSCASWHANSQRNGFGYMVMPLLAIGALVSFISLSASANALPVFLFSSLFSIAFPIISLVIPLCFLAILNIYSYCYEDKQEVNRYKLDFSPETKERAPLNASALQKGYQTFSIEKNQGPSESKDNNKKTKSLLLFSSIFSNKDNQTKNKKTISTTSLPTP